MEKEQEFLKENGENYKEEFLKREFELLDEIYKGWEEEKPSEESMKSELNWKIRHFTERFSPEGRTELIEDNRKMIGEFEEKLKNSVEYEHIRLERLAWSLKQTNRILQGIQDGKF